MSEKSWQEKILEFHRQENNNGKLLIEEVTSLVSLHRLCVYAYIICQAKNLTPVFLATEKNKGLVTEVVAKYFPQYEVACPSALRLRDKFGCLVASFSLWARVLVSRDLVNIQRGGVPIGDIIYDQYLSSCQKATLHYFDINLLKIIFLVNRALSIAHIDLAKIKPRAVLLSHKVGLSGAPLASRAEKLDLPLYSFGGAHYGTLFRSNKRRDYMFYADSEAIAPILALPDRDFDKIYDIAVDGLFSGREHEDAQRAYAHKLFRDRADFAETFRVSMSKKNIFVMLHAFTDYPHSHFNGMLFDDYYDWFIKTLEFAMSDDSVNWIIKEHPSKHLYPVQDMNWAEIKSKFSAPHICFLDDNADFNTQSICHVGDAIITCMGSAGFELPALGGVASITAGDNSYANAGFAISPNTRDEYFTTLSKLSSVEKLSPELHRRAKAVFIYLYRVSQVEMITIPDISKKKSREIQFSNEYFSYVDEQVEERLQEAKDQLLDYIDRVSEADFRLLQTKPEILLASISNSEISN